MASVAKGKILAVIGDEDTVVGFLLGGVGELNKVSSLFLFIFKLLVSGPEAKLPYCRQIDRSTRN